MLGANKKVNRMELRVNLLVKQFCTNRHLRLPVQKNVLLGPAQAGLGWPYLAQAGLALP